MLAWGHYLYVDDLSTVPAARGRGHADLLLAWVVDEGRRLGCRPSTSTRESDPIAPPRIACTCGTTCASRPITSSSSCKRHNGRMLGVIGGSGFYPFFGSDARSISLDTPYGAPSAPITVGKVGEHEVAFLPRHGVNHEFSPHAVPYRANLWALARSGCGGSSGRARSAA